MRIKNGFIYHPEGRFEPGELIIKNGIIASVMYSKDIIKNHEGEITDNSVLQQQYDAKGAYIIPGLIDTHIHGAKGYDFCDGSIEGLLTLARYLKSQGITAFCPTSMTLSKEALVKIYKTAGGELPNDCAEIVGIHMEGPFLSRQKKGAQNETYLQVPKLSLFNELREACGDKIKIVTIAPELEGSMEFIRECSYKTNISIGHTKADYKIADEAFALGANRVTHLYNAMTPFSHRDPGVIGAAFDHKEVFVELIADGIHIHPSVLRSTFEMFGKDRVVLISDAMMAMGMEAGEYELGGQKVFMKEKKAVLADGTIAGSATNLMDCMRNLVRYGISLETAVRAATVNPAKSIGAFDTMGSIEEGKKANLVLLNDELEVVKVF